VSDFDRELGLLLARLRESSGLSQEALAAALGRDQPLISKVERGQRRVSVADLLAWLGGLGIPLADIVSNLETLAGNSPGDSLWRGSTDE
jgi:transcriptional regulator with XRE-family HTH domain